MPRVVVVFVTKEFTFFFENFQLEWIFRRLAGVNDMFQSKICHTFSVYFEYSVSFL